MENMPFEEVPVEATPPPQPATMSKVGKQAIAKMRAGHLPRNDANRPALDPFEQPRRFAVTDPLSLNSFSAFPNLRPSRIGRP
jgi:hypothetical protein